MLRLQSIDLKLARLHEVINIEASRCRILNWNLNLPALRDISEH